jgi:hypothetical protein
MACDHFEWLYVFRQQHHISGGIGSRIGSTLQRRPSEATSARAAAGMVALSSSIA